MSVAATAASWPAGVAIAAGAQPRITTNHGCYLVGQRVMITGSGFAPGRAFDVAVNGIDFGQSTTSAAGGFTSSLIPGGLGAGQAQQVERLDATDGTSSAQASFTLTRRAGARVIASGGNPHTLRAPFEVWGFALDGAHKPVYLHYLAPSGRVKRTLSLGSVGGQCGYLRTGRRQVFPFSPSVGNWTLQIDTSRTYSGRTRSPAARIKLRIG